MVPWLTLSVALAAAEPLELSALEPKALAERVWREDASLQEARAKVAQAEAERRKALLLPNPGLDLGVNTLPVGPLNPPGLKDPLLNVPNVAVGLSVLLELGKRGPRQALRQAESEAVALSALEQLRQRVLDLRERIGDVAAAQLQVETLTGLAGDAERLAALQAARADKGDASGLDADRARLERVATGNALASARGQLSAALRSCAEVVAAPCLPFRDAAQAGAWLDAPAEFDEALLPARPDLRALEASSRAAEAAGRLARGGRLPDPTVRAGYVRDQFVVSGNQQNSLFVGVSVPLPVFQRGHEDLEAAAVAARAASTERTLRLDAARAKLRALGAEAAAVGERLAQLRSGAIPLAQDIVARLDEAVSRGAASLPELLVARRTLSELLLSQVELQRTAYGLDVSRARQGGSPLELSPGDLP